MTTEAQTETLVNPDPPPFEPVVQEMIEEPAPAPKTEVKAKPAAPVIIRKPAVPRETESADIRAIQIAEDATLRAMLEGLGTNGAFKVVVSRLEPEEVQDPRTSRRVKTSGMLKTYREVIDEEFIQKRHGGGRYQLDIHRATGKGEQMVKFRVRQIEIAGEPLLDDPAITKLATPAAAPAQAAAPVAAESDKLALRAMEMMERQVERGGAAPSSDTKAFEMMIDSQNRQIVQLQQQLADATKAMLDLRATPQNPVENRLLDKLIDQDSARMLAMRAQHESEIRMLKDQHADEVKRLNDRFDRMLDSTRGSFEREIAALKSSQDVLKIVQDSASSTTKEVLQGQIKALERTIESKDREIERLNAIKIKSPLDTVKEMRELKEVFDEDKDDEEEGGTISSFVNKLPDVINAAGSFIGKGPQQQAPAQQLPAPAPKPAMIRDARTGQLARLNPADGQYYPVKRQVKAAPESAPVEIPAIPPERLQQIVSMLEGAYQNGTEPETAAQTAKSFLAGQEEIFQAIRSLGGVDVFLSKVANLRSDSPLATQAGKNWVRKFSKALVGE